MHAFENQLFDRLRFYYLELTQQFRPKIEVRFPSGIDHEDVLVFVCNKNIFHNPIPEPQTILASRVCTPKGTSFLYLPAGNYWLYWIPISSSAPSTIHEAYTSIYKSPSIAQALGRYST